MAETIADVIRDIMEKEHGIYMHRTTVPVDIKILQKVAKTTIRTSYSGKDNFYSED